MSHGVILFHPQQADHVIPFLVVYVQCEIQDPGPPKLFTQVGLCPLRGAVVHYPHRAVLCDGRYVLEVEPVIVGAGIVPEVPLAAVDPYVPITL